MQAKTHARLTTLALLAGLAVLAMTSSASPAQAPSLEISESSLRTRLLAEDVRNIERYVAYWVDQISNATTGDQIDQARKSLRQGFVKYDQADSPAATYRYSYAAAASQIIAPRLKKPMKLDDPLGAARLSTLALAMVDMPDAAIRPALDEMVRAAEPVVRYLGWEGYANIRTNLLIQGQVATQDMLKTLKDRAEKEDSPAVQSAMMKMAALPVTGTSAVRETLPKAQAAAVEMAAALWPKVCAKAISGNEEAVNAARYGVDAMVNLAQAPAMDEAARKRIFQMIFDAMYCGGIVYDEAQGEGTQAELAALLLSSAENALNTLTKSSKRHIVGPLANPRFSAQVRRTEVRLGVLKWLGDLKDQAVAKPNYPAPAEAAAAVQPATAGN